MDTLLQDIKYGLRLIIRKPGFAAMIVGMLALGIGLNTVIFSVVDAALLRPLPFKDSDRLMLMSESYKQTQRKATSYPNYVDWRSQNQTFEEMGAYAGWDFSLVGEGEPERFVGSLATASLFPTLGVTPLIGREFTEEEDSLRAEPVTILSYSLWQRRFGGDESVVGKAYTLNGRPTVIIGVMPPGFKFPNAATEIWVTMSPVLQQTRGNRGSRPGIYVVGRLRNGVSIAQARADMDGIARRIADEYPQSNAEHGVWFLTLREEFVGDLGPAFLVLMAAVAFVLLIACANAANLLLARAALREKEIAIRQALGAGRARILRQLLTESLMLSLMAAALGLLLAFWGIDLISALLGRATQTPGMDSIGIDGRVLIFTLAVALLTGLIFGLAPALHSARSNLRDSLQSGGRSSSAPVRNRVRGALVIIEVALSLVLLAGAGLMIQTFQKLLKANPGFNPENVLTFRVSTSSERYSQPAVSSRFFNQLIEQVQTIPGVKAVGAALPPPIISGSFQNEVTLEDSPVATPQDKIRTDYARVTVDYFKAMEIPLVKGRYFTEQDTSDSVLVTIIDETMASEYFPGVDPIGRRIRMQNRAWQIVGVVGHVKNYGVNAPSRVEAFFSHEQLPAQMMTLALKTEGDPTAIVAAARNAVHEIDPNLPVYNIRTMNEAVAGTVSNERAVLILLGVFAAVALLLAVLGIYGVISSSVSQRTNEIGVRMALGATRADVLNLVLKQGLILTLIGVGVGIAAALALTRFLSSMLYGVGATDAMTFIAAPVVMAAIALAAIYVPARRATKVDPMIALRYE